MIPANGHYSGVPEAAALENGEVGCAAADVDQRDPELLLVLGQDGLTGRQLLENRLRDGDPGPVDAGHDVLGRRGAARDDVDVHLEP